MRSRKRWRLRPKTAFLRACSSEVCWMNRAVVVDLFVEDRGHEALLKPLLERLGRERHRDVSVQVRAARGGHGNALAELALYQKSVLKRGLTMPDLLVIAIDANCSSFTQARASIEQHLEQQFADRAVPACPDPHVERWYLADLNTFHRVVGIRPRIGRQKCQRDVYKALLAQAVINAGHPPTLGGLEFADELASAMDFYRAGKADNSLKHFLEEAAARLKSA
jgi:hypothetical protein